MGYFFTAFLSFMGGFALCASIGQRLHKDLEAEVGFLKSKLFALEARLKAKL